MSCTQENYQAALDVHHRPTTGKGWMGLIAALLTDIEVRARHQVEIRGHENYTHSRPTLVVANHRRDTDGPIVGSFLLQRRGLRCHGAIPSFVAREDLFTPGFLEHYLTCSPALIRHLAGRVNIRPIIESAGTYPMRRIPERTLGEVLTDVLRLFGNRPLEEILRPVWAQRFGEVLDRAPRTLTIRDALDPRCRQLTMVGGGYRKLRIGCFQRLKPFERVVIESQLTRFIALLEAGNLVILKPEGAVSPDGLLGTPRGALYELINRTTAPLSVLPISITYDCMDSEDTKVFLNIGRQTSRLRGLSRAQLKTWFLNNLRGGCTVTCSQLAAHWLRCLAQAGQHRLWGNELCEFVTAAAGVCNAAGLHVDPRLREATSCRLRVERWLQYCLRHGLLYTDGRDGYRTGRLDLPPGWLNTPRVSLLTYFDNELQATAGNPLPELCELHR